MAILFVKIVHLDNISLMIIQMIIVVSHGLYVLLGRNVWTALQPKILSVKHVQMANINQMITLMLPVVQNGPHVHQEREVFLDL